MLLAMKEHDIAFEEKACSTVYIEENKSSHFRVFRDSWRIYRLLLTHFFRYSVSSLLSALLDEGLFVLLSRLLIGVVSGFFNRKLVFHSKASAGRSFLRYYALAIPQLLLQLLFTHGLCLLFGIGDGKTGLRALVYAVVMTVLFVASYCIQQRWVFVTERKEA